MSLQTELQRLLAHGEVHLEGGAWSRFDPEKKLPPGRSCGQCWNFLFCSGVDVMGKGRCAVREQRMCAYYPVRFRERTGV